MKVLVVLVAAWMALADAAPQYLGAYMGARTPYMGAPVAIMRAPKFDSAMIKSERLGGNFAYSVMEAEAYAAVNPIIQNVPTQVGVSYFEKPIFGQVTYHEPAQAAVIPAPAPVAVSPVYPAPVPAVPAYPALADPSFPSVGAPAMPVPAYPAGGAPAMPAPAYPAGGAPAMPISDYPAVGAGAGAPAPPFAMPQPTMPADSDDDTISVEAARSSSG